MYSTSFYALINKPVLRRTLELGLLPLSL